MSAPQRTPIPLRRLIAPGLFVALLFFYIFNYQGNSTVSSKGPWAFNGATMGTTYNVKVSLPEGYSGENKAVADAMTACLESVNQRMSTYIPDSELSRFNQHASTKPFEASKALIEVVREAQRISALSEGAFDVTVGPLVDAWGFGPETRGTPPTSEQLATLRERVGYMKLRVGEGLQKDHPMLHVDLSSIAKGYGVDECARRLDSLGFQHYMVEVGGEVRVKGRNPEGEPWRIGIERPEVSGREIHQVVSLTDVSMATSGDYRNYYELDGQRISHTIDPRTGAPIRHHLASVSVLHADCMTADGYATMLNVLGPERGFELAQREGIAALFLVKVDDGFEERITDAFKALGVTQ